MIGALAGAAFLLGLLGGVHCMGMCGGITTALAGPQRGRGAWGIQAAYGTGRLATYASLGAVVGGLGGATLLLDHVLPVQRLLYGGASLMLVLTGLHLAGAGDWLRWLERPGQSLWRRIGPLLGRLLPADRPWKALMLGGLWGLVPCGLIYGLLPTALITGSAIGGAVVMAAFGLGTLPNLLAAGFLLGKLKRARHGRAVRRGAGALVMGFGVFGLVRVASLGGEGLAELLCLS